MARDPDREPADDDVPKLPRKWWRGRWAIADLFRIAMFATLLVAVIALRDDCSQGVARFVESFEPVPDAGPARSTAPAVPPGYEVLTPERARELFPDGDAGPGSEPAPATGGDAAGTASPAGSSR